MILNSFATHVRLHPALMIDVVGHYDGAGERHFYSLKPSIRMMFNFGTILMELAELRMSGAYRKEGHQNMERVFPARILRPFLNHFSTWGLHIWKKIFEVVKLRHTLTLKKLKFTLWGAGWSSQHYKPSSLSEFNLSEFCVFWSRRKRRTFATFVPFSPI